MSKLPQQLQYTTQQQNELQHRLSVLQLNLTFLVLKYFQIFMKIYRTGCTDVHMHLVPTSTLLPPRKKILYETLIS